MISQMSQHKMKKFLLDFHLDISYLNTVFFLYCLALLESHFSVHTLALFNTGTVIENYTEKN